MITLFVMRRSSTQARGVLVVEHGTDEEFERLVKPLRDVAPDDVTFETVEAPAGMSAEEARRRSL